MSVANPNRGSSSATNDERQLFVSTDIKAIPAFELKPMCRSLVEWLMAIVLFKVFRMESPAQFATESLRLLRIEPERVPKRIMKHFDQLRPKLERLEFATNYYATIPAIGPIAAAIMTMSPDDGRVHFFCVRAALKVNDEINDDGHFGFGSKLTDGTSVLTISPAKLPKARQGVDRAVVKSEDPATVLRRHHERIQGKTVQVVDPADMYEYAKAETRRESEDFLRRNIIRPATSAEITRIKLQSKG